MKFSGTMARFAVGFGIAAFAMGLSGTTASAAPSFSKLPAEMNEGRYAPAAATLPNGKVLVAGGYNQTGIFLKTAELFNPETGTFETLTAEMAENREEAAYTTLQNGQVLIAGGYDGSNLKSAELFNPTTNTFEKLTAEMNAERDGPAAALLHNGKVLIVGGYNETGSYLKTAELFNPETGTFEKLTAEANEARYAPAAATLPNGKVLIAGGYNETGNHLKTAELFDPETGTFEKLTAEMTENRDEAAYTTLQNGEVLIAGGYNATSLKSAELFNPVTNTFEKLTTEMNTERDGPAAALLHNGQVLIVGGYNEVEAGAARYLKSAEETTVTAPAVATTAASGVVIATATLNGTVLSEALSTAYFQYGTSTAYGASTAHLNVAASLGAEPVSASVAGLSPATTYHFRLVAENAGGVSYGADQTFTTASPPPAPVLAPTITHAHQSAATWREGNKLAQISHKRKVPVGTTFSFTLNEQASVTFNFTRHALGRKAGRRCVAQTRKNRKLKRCQRAVSAGTLKLTGHKGANKVVFQGRLSRSKKLAPGLYTLVIEATDSAGHSAPARLKFTIVK
jgi:N-acetylneuraminic acid mutarotase